MGLNDFFIRPNNGLKDREKRRVVLTNEISLVVFFASTTFIFVFYFMKLYFLSFLVIPTIFLFAISLILNKFGYYTAAKFNIIATTSLAIFYFTSVLGSGTGIQLLYIVFSIVPLVLFGSKEKLKMALGTTIPVVGWIALELSHLQIPGAIMLPERYTALIYYVACICIVSINVMFIRYYHKLNEIAEHKLENSNDKLEIINAELFKANVELDEANQKLKKSKEEQEKMVRQVEFANLVRHISHEFKNPMGMLISRMEATLENLDDKESIEEFATMTISVMERLGRLIDASLSSSDQIPSKDSGPYSIEKVLRDIQVLARYECAKAGLKMDLDCPKDLIAFGKEDHLHTCMINLVSNAIKHTHRGGKITISAEKASFTNLNQQNIDDGVVISVKDTGEGIPLENKDLIFSNMYSTKKTKNSYGLGLPTVLRNVHQERGALTLDSKEGEGSEFKIFLPASNSIAA